MGRARRRSCLHPTRRGRLIRHPYGRSHRSTSPGHGLPQSGDRHPTMEDRDNRRLEDRDRRSTLPVLALKCSAERNSAGNPRYRRCGAEERVTSARPKGQPRARKDCGTRSPTKRKLAHYLLRSVLEPANRGSIEDDAVRAVCWGGLLLDPNPERGAASEPPFLPRLVLALATSLDGSRDGVKGWGYFGTDGGLSSCASVARKGGCLARSLFSSRKRAPCKAVRRAGLLRNPWTQVRVLPSLRRGSSVAEHWGGSSEPVTSPDLVLALTMHAGG